MVDISTCRPMAYGLARVSTCRKAACLIQPRACMAVSYRTYTRAGILALSIRKSALEGHCWVEETLGVLPILFGKWGKDLSHLAGINSCKHNQLGR